VKKKVLLVIGLIIITGLLFFLAYVSFPRYEGSLVDTMSDNPDRKLVPPGMFPSIGALMFFVFSIWATVKLFKGDCIKQ
jgi:hypothetical protein